MYIYGQCNIDIYMFRSLACDFAYIIHNYASLQCRQLIKQLLLYKMKGLLHVSRPNSQRISPHLSLILQNLNLYLALRRMDTTA